MGNESYSDLLLRSVAETDLVMGAFWAHTTSRRSEGIMFLKGHVDFSAVMVVHPNVETVRFRDRIFLFFRPFYASLWVTLIASFVLAGFVDYMLERRMGARLGDSIYASWAGALWGGFEYPKTKAAAVSDGK